MPEAVGNEKIAFCLKKGVFYWASKPAISVEKGLFCRLKSAKSGGSNLGTSVIYRGVGNGTASRKYYTAPERGYYYAADDQVPTGAWPAKDAVGATKLDFFLAFFFWYLVFLFFLFFCQWADDVIENGPPDVDDICAILCVSEPSRLYQWHWCNLTCKWNFKITSVTLVQSYESVTLQGYFNDAAHGNRTCQKTPRLIRLHWNSLVRLWSNPKSTDK